MKVFYLMVAASLFALPSCKQDEISCSSLETQSFLKSLISTPRHSQEVEDYTAEIDISFSDLRGADLPSTKGVSFVLGRSLWQRM